MQHPDTGKTESGGDLSQGSRAGQSSLLSKWRNILDVGEQLLCVEGEDAIQTVEAQHDFIIKAAEGIIPGRASLWLSPDPSSTPMLADAGEESGSQQYTVPPSRLMKRVLEARRIHGAESGDSEESWWVYDSAAKDAFQAVAAPLLFHDQKKKSTLTLGILQVERRQGSPFGDDEIELFEGLSAQIAVGLQALRQMEVERWRMEQLSLARRVSVEIANLRDLDELSRRVTELILQTFHYYYVAIFSLDPGQEVLHFRASAGPLKPNANGPDISAGEMPSPPLLVRLGEGIIGHVARTGEALVANDIRFESHYQHEEMLPETRSEATLPLMIEGRVVGVLDVQSDKTNAFQETDMPLLRALAGNIAVAVESARLYTALHHHAEQLDAISEVSSAIASILDQDELLHTVVELIHERFGHPFAHIFSLHQVRRKIIFEAGSGERSQKMHEIGFGFDLDDPEGLIPWAARHGDTLVVNDVDLEPRYRPSILPPYVTRSELTVPLVFGDQVLGILDVQSDKLNAFTEDDRYLFEALADNIATAMRNAALYRSEKWRRNVADSLREVAGLLSEGMALDVVLKSILIELERTLPLDLAAIWLFDSDRRGDFSGDVSDLRLAALRGTGGELLEQLVGFSSLELLGFSSTSDSYGHRGHPPNLLLQAVETGQPVIRSPGSAYEPLGAAFEFPPNYSAIAAPLRLADRSLGVLTLSDHESGRYGIESQAMTAAFASYAAVAIENASLYEEAYDQAWISSVLLQVSESLQAHKYINELLSTVVEFGPMLSGVRANLLYLREEDGAFVPAAASGLTPEQQMEFERWRFAPGEVPSLDLLLEHPQPRLLSGNEDDLPLTAIFLAGAEQAHIEKRDLFILLPLLAQSGVLGAYVIHFEHLPANTGWRGGFQERFEETLTILQGIAFQTAIAVENLKLIKSQKEEAYISIALLQVAQAVVSSKQLDEILASIVRITPILVGVERSAFLLWDEAESIFQLSAAYGIPDAFLGSYYTGSEFPLLDIVRSENKIAAVVLTQSTAESGTAFESWQQYSIPEIDVVHNLHDSHAQLLMAFPLSIQDQVLGVFLLEEPAVSPIESYAAGVDRQHLREKRLEILTGISQQAALAVQNDHLQRETVLRERLEREFQLAREIQQAFLPRKLPELQGWSLDVRWRTAHEVGGDFYDIFMLPNGLLGVVIADVADKGMPAALFMTMVRTLVRAAVQQMEAPNEVLQYVNDVLVPDAQGGMFVTMVYGVLNAQSGEFTYANAGHNPPLLLRVKSQDIERLQRGGMALGVFEGIQVASKTVTLLHGDALVLYTDGITEAFSQEGQFFDEHRLVGAIKEYSSSASRQTGNDSGAASHLIEAVDRAVCHFLGDAPLPDDQTLMVFSRDLPGD